MREYCQEKFHGERALFASRDVKITDCVFEDGESPLKESRNVELSGSMFRWKYPLWYCRGVRAERCTWFEMARAGVWYTGEISVKDAVIQAPKNFRRCRGVELEDVSFSNAQETLWSCRDVKMKNVFAKGDYFAMNCEGLEADRLTVDGNYAFDGARNVAVRNSRLITKDAFWNSENVTVKDSLITGEYLGWNSRNLTLEGCTVESLQGLCYIENLVMRDCRLIDTTLAFEYSSVDAEITSGVDSVLNPAGGTISAPYIGELILERDLIDPGKTRIVCREVAKRTDRVEWRG